MIFSRPLCRKLHDKVCSTQHKTQSAGMGVAELDDDVQIPAVSLVLQLQVDVLLVVVVVRLVVLQDPPPVGPLHHVLVVVHLPAHGHGVLVGEAVVELVHQRDVPLHHQLEPAAAAALPPGDAVQVHLQVVRLRLAAVGLEERRPARVDEQLDAHVGVAHRRVVRDAVGLVPDAEHPEAREAVEDVSEGAVTRARAAEHHGGDRCAAAVVKARGFVVGGCDDVCGVERGQGRAQAVPDDGDARLLVLVFVHQPCDLCQYLLRRTATC